MLSVTRCGYPGQRFAVGAPSYAGGMVFDDAAQAIVELAASRHNAFHTLEAAAHNISARRLRRAKERGVLRSLHPKVWAIDAIGDSPLQTLRAATLALPESAATGESAAWLWGWLDQPPTTAQVWVPEGMRRSALGTKAYRCPRLDWSNCHL